MRHIQAPGIELNEFDRSQYNVQSSVLDDAPYCFICGFADKGENYAVKYIDSKSTLLKTFGQPQTEFEKYFYNGCIEVIQDGGICLASRLPYDNESLDKYTYCDYLISQTPIDIPLLQKIHEDYEDLAGIKKTVEELVLKSVLFYDDAEHILSEYSLQNASSVVQCLNCLKDICIQKHGCSYEDFIDIEDAADIALLVQQLVRISYEKAPESYCHIRALDSNLTSYIQLSADCSSNGTGKITMKQLDDLKIGNNAAINGKMRIVDISKTNYEKSSQQTVSSVIEADCGKTIVETDDCLGIVPVIVTPANALYFQDMFSTIGEYAGLEDFGTHVDGHMYSQVKGMQTVQSEFMHGNDPTLSVDLAPLQDITNLTMPYESGTVFQQSLSRIASLQFPEIVFKNSQHIEPTYLKCIGIAVFKAYRDDANSGQVSFQLLESFVGSLDKNAKDESTGASIYIDKIVNQQSSYINVFTNVQPAVVQQASLLLAAQDTAASLGFYQLDLAKNITVTTSINGAISRLFAKIENPNEWPLDLIVDAGVSNIAQYVASKSASLSPSSFVYKLENADDAKVWQMTLRKFDDFCKYTRRDCMFIGDGHRGFCLLNDSKIVRDTDPSSSVQTSILPKLRLMSGLNSSYSAGYCNWFLSQDEYSGDFFWCPPSIKVLRSYIYCDTYCQPWSVPAGMNRGQVRGAIDVAFQPTVDEAGKIYQQTWNYAVSYPSDGIVIEGQKTFQKAYTALDRVNVRRLMLYLEKRTVSLARHFLYEGNTEYLRQQFVDAITPVYDDAVNNNGILEYAIKCDDELNTPQVIDNNEMRCKIAVKPVKALEFLVLDFIVTNQSANVNEEVRR